MRRLLWLLAMVSCSVPPKAAPLAGERLPDVRGESLDGREWQLPAALAGEPAILIVAFEMRAQFDCDRWLQGLLQAQTPVALLEVPTIPGMFPTLFSGTIDGGMRSGIPSEDWGSVVTLYGSDARRLLDFTGGVSDRNARVLLLDRDGRVVWQQGRGYSARLLVELDGLARSLKSAEASPAR